MCCRVCTRCTARPCRCTTRWAPTPCPTSSTRPNSPPSWLDPRYHTHTHRHYTTTSSMLLVDVASRGPVAALDCAVLWLGVSLRGARNLRTWWLPPPSVRASRPPLWSPTRSTTTSDTSAAREVGHPPPLMHPNLCLDSLGGCLCWATISCPCWLGVCGRSASVQLCGHGAPGLPLPTPAAPPGAGGCRHFLLHLGHHGRTQGQTQRKGKMLWHQLSSSGLRESLDRLAWAPA